LGRGGLLHLVPAWEQALDELVRVLRPGGRLLVLLGREAELARELRDRVGVAAGRGRPGVVGLASDADLDALLVDRGLLARSLPEIPNPQTVTVAELLERVAAQQYAWTWPIEPGLLRRAVAETTAWVRATHGEPTEVVIRGWSVRWRAYDLPC
jgi:SAM-dependent methyltransferase